MGWVGVGVTTWVVGSVPLALVVGKVLRAGGSPGRRASARRSPAHLQQACVRRGAVRGAV